MTDKEFVHKFLNKNYRMGCGDTHLCCYDSVSKKRYDLVTLLNEVKTILGEFATFTIIDKWYGTEINKITTIINDKLKKIDLSLGPFVASHEFAQNLRYIGLTKTYLDTVFISHYI